jgi:catechol 2,3-dioxygenase-like lactoylglutathione lyase family enzyme
MFSHVMVGSNDIARSQRFYDALFTAVGGKAGVIDHKGRLVYVHDGALFMVTKPIDGETATHANGGTIGFRMPDNATVDRWHEAGVAHGGKPIEEPPGVRSHNGRGLYLAYLRDPDGNKLCAVHVVKA